MRLRALIDRIRKRNFLVREIEPVPETSQPGAPIVIARFHVARDLREEPAEGFIVKGLIDLRSDELTT